MNKHERLRLFRNTLKLNQSDIATKLGIKSGSYSKIEIGSVSLTSEHLETLYDIYSLNPIWYLRGDGNMFLQEEKNRFSGSLDTITKSSVAELVHLGIQKEIANNKAAVIIPIYDIKATAGNAELIFPQNLDVENMLFIPELKGCDFAVKVEGDSMQGMITQGDMIACKNVSSVDDIINGRIYLIQTESNLYVKYAYKNSIGLILNSENKQYEPIILSFEQVRNIYEVVWAIRLNKL